MIGENRHRRLHPVPGGQGRVDAGVSIEQDEHSEIGNVEVAAASWDPSAHAGEHVAVRDLQLLKDLLDKEGDGHSRGRYWQVSR